MFARRDHTICSIELGLKWYRQRRPRAIGLPNNCLTCQITRVRFASNIFSKIATCTTRRESRLRVNSRCLVSVNQSKPLLGSCLLSPMFLSHPSGYTSHPLGKSSTRETHRFPLKGRLWSHLDVSEDKEALGCAVMRPGWIPMRAVLLPIITFVGPGLGKCFKLPFRL